MPVIKRYPNRKLYDTEAKRYVTLSDIATLIRSGHEVVVVDHATDEDLTAVTLSQIIFEQEKQQGGFLPLGVLTSLVRVGGDSLSTLRRGLSLPLDAWRHVDEEIDRRLQYLMSKGELAKEEGQRLRAKLLSPIPFLSDSVSKADGDLNQLLNGSGTSLEELERLHAQLHTLTTRLEGLIEQAKEDEEIV
jgi:polyhydroxyalkanoate synthesis repressor PhaR